MRILAIGDPHFKTTNIKESTEMVNAIYNLLEKEQDNLDFIIVMGDILDRHETIHVNPLTLAVKFLLTLATKKKTYVLIGNHDRPNNSDFLSDYHPFVGLNNINNLVIIDKVIIDTINNKNFIFVPYVYPGLFKKALYTLNEKQKINDILDPMKITCIFCHQEFYGTKMGSIISVSGDKWNTTDPMIISGHIHDYYRPQENIIYIGTPMQHAFGDRDDKTVSIFTFHDNCKIPDEHRVDLNLTKKYIINIDCKDLSSWTPPENGLIKLVIKGSSSEIKAIKKFDYLKDLMKKNIKITYKPTDDFINTMNIKETIKDSSLDTLKLPYAIRLKEKVKNNEYHKKLLVELFPNLK